jgi:acyl CoA:acetate/3-ketoacid CoA transferase
VCNLGAGVSSGLSTIAAEEGLLDLAFLSFAEVDAEGNVIAQMGFRPIVAGALKPMDPRIFRPGLMGIAADIHAKPRAYRSQRVARWHEQHS